MVGGFVFMVSVSVKEVGLLMAILTRGRVGGLMWVTYKGAIKDRYSLNKGIKILSNKKLNLSNFYLG